MGLRATVKGDFLSAELRPWEFKDSKTGELKRGQSVSISILQEEDSVRLSAKEDLFGEMQKLERMTPVTLEVDLFRDRDSGAYKPKVTSIAKAGEVRAVKSA
jgi:hypothetical protein